MNRLAKFTLLLSLLLALAAIIGGILIWQELAAHPQFSISINGEAIELDALHSMHWAGLLFGGVIASLVLALLLLILLPLLLLLGLGLPLLLLALCVGAAVLGVASAGALLFSPLILLALLLWWMLRSKPAAQSAAK
jgi:hypothetical protein